MGLAVLAGGLMAMWGALLLALGRGAYIIPRAEVARFAKRATALTFLAGLPAFFALSMAVGELTHLIPLPARAEGSLLLALLTLPLYSMLAVVAVVERAGEVYRRPAGAVALLGRAVVALISLAAALFTLAAIFTSAGRYFAP